MMRFPADDTTFSTEAVAVVQSDEYRSEEKEEPSEDQRGEMKFSGWVGGLFNREKN